MRITTKGQVTVPQNIRQKFGFLPETEVEFCVEGNKVYLRKSKISAKKPSRDKGIVSKLRGRGDVKLSTDQILALTREK